MPRANRRRDRPRRGRRRRRRRRSRTGRTEVEASLRRSACSRTKTFKIIVLIRLARDLQPLFPRGAKRVVAAGAQHHPESERPQAGLEPAEVGIHPTQPALLGPRRQMESVDDPAVVGQQLEQAGPGRVGLHCPRLLIGGVVDQAPTPGNIAEATPLGRHERRGVLVLAVADQPGVAVQGQGEVGLMGEPGCPRG